MGPNMASTSDSTRFWSTITPNDSQAKVGQGTASLPNGECNYIYVGGTGNLTATCNSVDVLFSNLAVGYHPIKATCIKATGTTCTLILAAN